MSEQYGDSIDRRCFAFGVLSTLAGIVGIGAIAAATDGADGSGRSGPSSEVLSATGRVYDEYAEMCAIDLVVDIARTERVLLSDDSATGTDRSVDNAGERTFRAIVPAGSAVLVYAVDLGDRTSKRLKSYHVRTDCTLSEATHE